MSLVRSDPKTSLSKPVGWALMSIGNVLFAAVAIAANLAATHFYIMGGSLFGHDDEREV